MPGAKGTLTFDADRSPQRVHHASGLFWNVGAVLCHWQHPAPAGRRLRMRGIVECWRMRVWGPLPGEPGRNGEFTMTARTRGNRPGWLLSPGPGECECMATLAESFPDGLSFADLGP